MGTLALAASYAAPVDAEDRVVAREAQRTTVAAYGGRMAWSHYDEDRDAYVLMTESDGVVRRVGVASRGAPFDVDLGPHGGSTIAVYSRCRLEAPLPLGQERRRPAEGCDLFSYDFATGREEKVGGASTDTASEYLPTVWRDTIAFARVYEQRSGTRGIRFRWILHLLAVPDLHILLSGLLAFLLSRK